MRISIIKICLDCEGISIPDFVELDSIVVTHIIQVSSESLWMVMRWAGWISDSSQSCNKSEEASD